MKYVKKHTQNLSFVHLFISIFLSMILIGVVSYETFFLKQFHVTCPITITAFVND